MTPDSLLPDGEMEDADEQEASETPIDRFQRRIQASIRKARAVLSRSRPDDETDETDDTGERTAERSVPSPGISRDPLTVVVVVGELLLLLYFGLAILGYVPYF